MIDEDEARRRLLIYTALRAMGVGIFMFGVAVIFTSVLRAGGWPQVGAVLAIVGASDALLIPHLLKRRWDKDGGGGQ